MNQNLFWLKICFDQKVFSQKILHRWIFNISNLMKILWIVQKLMQKPNLNFFEQQQTCAVAVENSTSHKTSAKLFGFCKRVILWSSGKTSLLNAHLKKICSLHFHTVSSTYHTVYKMFKELGFFSNSVIFSYRCLSSRSSFYWRLINIVWKNYNEWINILVQHLHEIVPKICNATNSRHSDTDRFSLVWGHGEDLATHSTKNL